MCSMPFWWLEKYTSLVIYTQKLNGFYKLIFQNHMSLCSSDANLPVTTMLLENMQCDLIEPIAGLPIIFCDINKFTLLLVFKLNQTE